MKRKNKWLMLAAVLLPLAAVTLPLPAPLVVALQAALEAVDVPQDVKSEL